MKQVMKYMTKHHPITSPLSLPENRKSDIRSSVRDKKWYWTCPQQNLTTSSLDQLPQHWKWSYLQCIHFIHGRWFLWQSCDCSWTAFRGHVIRFIVQMCICTTNLLPFKKCRLGLRYLLYTQMQCIMGCWKVTSAQCESQWLVLGTDL